MNSKYNDAFFAGFAEKALRSARIVVPLTMELVFPTSVVDVGCGVGAWLKAFTESGVQTIRGLDGAYIDASKLLIDKDYFSSVDLRKPLTIDGHFDLALCLEVAEHLPIQCAANLVRTLTTAAQLVLFSAGLPGQGGIGHVNEQWPTYWRQLFEAEGFRMFDPIRPAVREDRRVDWWYRQNLVLFAHPAEVFRRPRLRSLDEAVKVDDTEWIHITTVMRQGKSLEYILPHLPSAAWRAVKEAFRVRTRFRSVIALLQRLGSK